MLDLEHNFVFKYLATVYYVWYWRGS